ncbi:MAG: 16S rRNA methyltransferase [Nitrososphaerota archaeon]|nr:16S rRNA methyltransferase [Candidatus Bathyarchaeota archaeon]MDW8061893.1 16S rRNA methyltransferase [Nitrososphaerota archaeon]
MAFEKLVFIAAESALELIPDELKSHPDIKRYARKIGVDINYVLLDRSYHHHAMFKLKDSEKRGRPDIVHYMLLSALETPLCWEGMLEVHVHAYGNNVVHIDPEVRIPKNHLRFQGIVRQLFKYGKVPPDSEKPLLVLHRETLKVLIEEVKPDIVVGLSERGKPETIARLASRLIGYRRPTIVVGGFPHGEFSEDTLKLLDEVVCIDPKPMHAWIVTARIIHSFEEALGLDEKRIRMLGSY